MTIKQRVERGEAVPELEAVARQEGVAEDVLRDGIRAGSVVLPRNRLRTPAQPRAIGDGLSTKINANIGASSYRCDRGEELRKLEVAVAAGADAVMDLSLGKRIEEIREAILEQSPVPVGTVPIYQMGYDLSARQRTITELTLKDALAAIERQAAQGVDFMTIHSGITRGVMETMTRQGRLLDTVSRGGSMLVNWLRHNSGESPLYEGFDEILDVLAEYDVTLSLGDGMRPGTTADATDRAQIGELSLLGELAERAWAKGVQVLIEGPGHVPLQDVADSMRLAKRLCGGAPLYVLGPLVTDLAAGHDHIAGAIGGALAALHGANFLCYVTPAEHLSLPTVDDVREGVIASRIAAQAADVARGLPAALERERAMARARKALDWDRQIELSIDGARAHAIRASSGIGNDETCTMCGEFCAIRQAQLT